VTRTTRAPWRPPSYLQTRPVPLTQVDFFLSITIIIKSIVGAGIISLPYTMSRLGFIFTIITFLIFGTLNQLCCSLLLRAKNLSGHSNYSTIMGYIWGNKLSKFLGSLIIFLDNFGTCTYGLMQAYYSSSFSKVRLKRSSET